MNRFPRFSIIMVILLFLGSCSSEKVQTKYNPHVAAFTSGSPSIESTIMVRLSETVEKFAVDEIIDEKLFSISPSVSGKTILFDDQTIQFIPNERLKPGTDYKVVFDVGKALSSKIESDNRKFEFSFTTIEPDYYVSSANLELYDETQPHLFKLVCQFKTIDYADNDKVEEMVKVKADFKFGEPKWEHTGNRTHTFVIDSIAAGEKSSDILIEFNGKSIKSERKQENTVRVPSKYEFSLMGVEVTSEPQSVKCSFSAPIDAKQNLNGLIGIKISNDKDVRCTYKVKMNEVTVYPSQKITGSVTLFIAEGLKSSAGGKFTTTYEEEIAFESYSPEVKFLNKGTILPNSEGLILPFQAVNMRAVRAKVIRIYENNVMQFLQVNKMDGSSEIKRAGRVVAVKTIRLDEKTAEKDLKRWNTYAIDLSKLIEPEPGAIYRVELSIEKANAIIDCSDETDDEGNTVATKAVKDDETYLAEQEKDDDTIEGSSYYYYDDYYYDDYWENRDNPCKEYYYPRKTIAKNVFASNLGIIAKQGSDNTINVAITDMVSLMPMKGVTVEIYNYQQQIIGQAQTDAEGLAELSVNGKAFLLIAKSDKQRGYLQMQDGYSISLSRFDVAGKSIDKGLKGYIYGERGVWRPGDTLFLGFVLQNKGNKIPAGHPVNLEIVNARGQVVNKQTKTGNDHGFYTFIYKTDDGAPTGNWTARVKVGGTEFTKVLKIETVKPNRLKINIDFEQKDVINASKSIGGTLNAAWLHGAPAKNMRANIKLYLNTQTTTFKSFPGYVFDDATQNFTSQESEFLSGELNEQGNLRFNENISVKNAPGMLKANFVTRVFEESGDFSIDNISKTISPYSKYVGIMQPKGTGHMNMLETEKDQAFSIVTVDDKGMEASRNVVVNVYKLGWSWWWSSSNQSLANFSHSSYQTPVLTKHLSTTGGKAYFNYKADRYEYGFYLIKVQDEGGHSTSTVAYYDWPGWGGRARQDSEGPVMLNFTSNKEKYQVGETAKITFPSMGGAKALVSIENGSKVLQSFWINTAEGQTDFDLNVTPAMTPNVYVSITLLQPHAQTKNDMPIRLFGVIPIVAEDPNTKLTPVIQMAESLRPEEKYTIKISETNKKEMTYTLAVVDEGLLDLTRFATPNAWTEFYAREALGIRTWDMYDAVVGAYGGKIEQLFAIGGDDAATANKNKVSRFKPVVTFVGPFTLGKGDTKTHELSMPNYIGSVRVMVVAGNNQAYGSAEKAVPVRKPLMILATLPRVLGPGEEVDLPVNVFAMESNIKNVDIKVEANELFQIETTSKSVRFSSPGDEIVSFRLKVKETVGKGVVKIVATSGGEKSTYEVELEVRNPNPPITTVESKLLAGNTSLKSAFALKGVEGSNTGVLEFSTLPPLNLEKRLGYLLRYPHGCLEQTTSTIFPQLYLNSVVEMSKEEVASADKNIKAGINRLKSFVTLEGGFSYWPGERYPNLWASSYAGDFLLEAKAKGYTMPPNVLENWIKFQQKEARNWSKAKKVGEYYAYSQSDLDQAYRLYTLAKAKAAETGAMNRLKEAGDLSVQARWTLAAAYALIGQKEVADKLISNAGTSIPEYSSNYSQTYGSSIRDKAMIVDALVHMKKKGEAFKLIKDLSESLNSQTWMSTQTSAYCLMAISRYAESNKEGKMDLEYTYNGKTEKLTSNKVFAKVNLGKLNSSKPDIEIKNKGGDQVYVQIACTGIPLAGEESAVENGMKIAAQYLDSEGRSINVDKMTQGTDFTARVRITNTGSSRYTNVALTQIFPSGWEIMNDRLLGLDNSDNFDYCDIRDDRVYTYFSLSAGNTISFTVKLNAAYTGRFYLPAFKAEPMYDGMVNANNVGGWVEVVK